MFKHILVPTDGSELSAKCISQAIEFAKSLSARVTGITVSQPFHVFSADPLMVTDTEDRYQADCEKRAAGYLKPLLDAAAAAGVPCQGEHRFATHPYEAVIAAAMEKGCDAVCMASHGRRGIA